MYVYINYAQFSTVCFTYVHTYVHITIYRHAHINIHSTDIVYTLLTVVYDGICQYINPVGWTHFFSHATKSSEVRPHSFHPLTITESKSIKISGIKLNLYTSICNGLIANTMYICAFLLSQVMARITVTYIYGHIIYVCVLYIYIK